MSTQSRAFAEYHAEQISEMLTIAEELPLFHTPLATSMGNPYKDQLTTETAESGSFSEQLSMAEFFGIGTSLLIDFRARLGDKTDKKIIDAYDYEIKNALYGTSRFVFKDTPSEGTKCQISTISIVGARNLLNARSLSITTRDDAIKKHLELKEVNLNSNSPDVDISFSVEQNHDKIINDLLKILVELGSDSDADLSPIMSVMISELSEDGGADQEIQNLLTKHQYSSRFEDLEQALLALKTMVASTKSSIEFEASFGNLGIPTSEEFAGHLALMRALKA